jgi:hypothetical protein
MKQLRVLSYESLTESKVQFGIRQTLIKGDWLRLKLLKAFFTGQLVCNSKKEYRRRTGQL